MIYTTCNNQSDCSTSFSYCIMTIILPNNNTFAPSTVYKRQMDSSCSKHLAVTCIPELHPRTLGGWLVAIHFTDMYIYTKLPITVCSRNWFQNSCYTTSLIPRLGGGGKRTRYTMFAHVLSSLGNMHTTPLH